MHMIITAWHISIYAYDYYKVGVASMHEFNFLVLILCVHWNGLICIFLNIMALILEVVQGMPTKWNRCCVACKRSFACHLFAERLAVEMDRRTVSHSYTPRKTSYAYKFINFHIESCSKVLYSGDSHHVISCIKILRMLNQFYWMKYLMRGVPSSFCHRPVSPSCYT